MSNPRRPPSISPADAQLIKDLGNKLHADVDRATRNYIELCKAANTSRTHSYAELLHVLTHMACALAVPAFSEDEYLALTLMTFRKLDRAVRKADQ